MIGEKPGGIIITGAGVIEGGRLVGMRVAVTVGSGVGTSGGAAGEGLAQAQSIKMPIRKIVRILFMAPLIK
ncbi:hypothetical protein [Candidatus Villigracilis saccharophilus]|uniref:hypothetical protein n=1 Tax=Candidatus Villigracilis saccharophilus TaxID=3140684 RepID=UPI0031357F53|nr:hypothetical protein [Anaerolineales bacterium]